MALGIFFLALCLLPVSYCYSTYKVHCNATTPTCTCPYMYNGERINVCLFSLNIQVLQSFTSYYLPVELEGRAAYGRPWYINSTTGELLPIPGAKGRCDDAVGEGEPHCSLPFTMDGYTYRSVISVNGQFPGPTLIAQFNQTLVINVTNWLGEEEIGIHWHGLHQKGTNWMDGVPGLTQCGIEPGQSFRYIFQADPPGTFWYHSHSGTQRDDGFFGALIIKEKEEMIHKVKDSIGIQFVDTPEYHTLTLFDLQQSPSMEVYSRMQAHTLQTSFFSFLPPQPDIDINMSRPVDFGATEASPIPYWSGIVNGRGRHPSIDYTGTRLSIFTISPFKEYRFRIIGAQASFTYMLSIDEHSMTIVATDASFVKPVTVDYVIISSGERYDVIVNGKGMEELDERHNFMIRARTLEPILNGNLTQPLQYRTDHTVEAILHYDIAPKPNSTEYGDIADNSIPVDEKCSIEEPCIVLNCPFPSFSPLYNFSCLHIHNLELLYPISDGESPNVVPDQTIFLNFAFGGYDGSSTVNARNFKIPDQPLSLLNSSELQNVKDDMFCKDLDDPSLCDNNLENDAIFPSTCLCSHIKEVSFNQSVQLVFSALGPNPENLIPYSSSHPIHLHGHQFQVVDIQFGSYDDTGRLSKGNTDINCGGTNLCTVPQWKNGKGYSVGKKGIVNATAPLKDTILIPAGGYAVVYIKATNPGYWHLHCHVDPHLIEGMAIVLSEAVDKLSSPPKEMHQCGTFDWSLDEYFDILNDKTPPSSTPSPTVASSDCQDTQQVLLYTIVGMSVLLVLLLTALFITTSCLCWLTCFKKLGRKYTPLKPVTESMQES